MDQITIKRRKLLGMGIAGMALFTAGGLARRASANSAASEDAPFFKISDIGPLGEPDHNGVMLPPGFSYRIVAQSGLPPTASSSYDWHPAPDGGATFPMEDGGWVYVSNSELRDRQGGVGALRFDANANIIDAYSILSGTSVNCAGGGTPWGTWLSCEEIEEGQVYECDPLGKSPAQVRPLLGTFKHEAVAVDMTNNQLYLTEDLPDGGFYRFTSSTGLPDLSRGQLQIAAIRELDGETFIEWRDVADPLARHTPTRQQVTDAAPFRGGEGVALHDGKIYFTTKRDNRVWCYEIDTQKLEVIYDAAINDNPILTGVDNVVITPGGDVLVAEDGGNMQLIAITPELELIPLIQIAGHERSEITGPAFDPSFTRLYFSSQRGAAGNHQSGVTYEITRA